MKAITTIDTSLQGVQRVIPFTDKHSNPCSFVYFLSAIASTSSSNCASRFLSCRTKSPHRQNSRNHYGLQQPHEPAIPPPNGQQWRSSQATAERQRCLHAPGEKHPSLKTARIAQNTKYHYSPIVKLQDVSVTLACNSRPKTFSDPTPNKSKRFLNGSRSYS